MEAAPSGRKQAGRVPPASATGLWGRLPGAAAAVRGGLPGLCGSVVVQMGSDGSGGGVPRCAPQTCRRLPRPSVRVTAPPQTWRGLPALNAALTGPLPTGRPGLKTEPTSPAWAGRVTVPCGHEQGALNVLRLNPTLWEHRHQTPRTSWWRRPPASLVTSWWRPPAGR